MIAEDLTFANLKAVELNGEGLKVKNFTDNAECDYNCAECELYEQCKGQDNGVLFGVSEDNGE